MSEWDATKLESIESKQRRLNTHVGRQLLLGFGGANLGLGLSGRSRSLSEQPESGQSRECKLNQRREGAHLLCLLLGVLALLDTLLELAVHADVSSGSPAAIAGETNGKRTSWRPSLPFRGPSGGWVRPAAGQGALLES